MCKIQSHIVTTCWLSSRSMRGRCCMLSVVVVLARACVLCAPRWSSADVGCSPRLVRAFDTACSAVLRRPHDRGFGARLAAHVNAAYKCIHPCTRPAIAKLAAADVARRTACPQSERARAPQVVKLPPPHRHRYACAHALLLSFLLLLQFSFSFYLFRSMGFQSLRAFEKKTSVIETTA